MVQRTRLSPRLAASARIASISFSPTPAERALAQKRGETRVLWTTDEENTGAQRFYDRLGMKRIKKVYYVMDV